MNKLESIHKRLESLDKICWLYKSSRDAREARELREEIKKLEDVLGGGNEK